MKLHSIFFAATLACTLGSTQAGVAATATPSATQATLVAKSVDTALGNGKSAARGDTVSIHFTGWLYSPKAPAQRGAQIDTSKGGDPFTFQLGQAKVIKGLDDGVVGMRIGGKRTLIVPAKLGYGKRGAGPIPPNANLIFDIELLDVK